MQTVNRVYQCNHCGHVCESKYVCFRCRTNNQLDITDDVVNHHMKQFFEDFSRIEEKLVKEQKKNAALRKQIRRLKDETR